MTMIDIKHAGVRYNGGPEILHDLNLTIESGSYHYIAGASGCGKTTLSHILGLTLLPSRGDVSVLGENILKTTKTDRAHLRQKIGRIHQDSQLLDHLSIYDNIALPLRIMGRNDTQIQSAIHDVTQWLGIDSILKHTPPFISGGQQQRAAIARALITNPSLVIADEPTGNLDYDTAHKVHILFEELHKQGTTIIMATHNKEMISAHPHDVITLSNGTITS